MAFRGRGVVRTLYFRILDVVREIFCTQKNPPFFLTPVQAMSGVERKGGFSAPY
ncbi:hypothetical protein CCP3SC1_50058 [Gammaproteobacteria bacterium]